MSILKIQIPKISKESRISGKLPLELKVKTETLQHLYFITSIKNTKALERSVKENSEIKPHKYLAIRKLPLKDFLKLPSDFVQIFIF